MEHKNIQLYIIPFIAVAVFSLLLFGAGYAYFTSTVTMNSANYAINMPSTTSLICTKTDCSATITPDMMTNTNTNSTVAKSSSTCAVNCTCSGTPGATCNYNVSLLELDSIYSQSSGVNNKEFTVQVTSPTGCSEQNSSSTETAVNYIRNKKISSCSLTVPSSGSVSSTVSAEFKWYNLNVDQTRHAGVDYKYLLATTHTTGYTGVIYRKNSYESHNGDNISVLSNGYQKYEDLLSSAEETDFGDFMVTNFREDIHLKHIVIDDIIESTYVCFEDVCILADEPLSYGTYDGMSSTTVHYVTNPTGNIKKMHNYGTDMWTPDGPVYGCDFNSTSSYCTNPETPWYFFQIYSNGNVKIGCSHDNPSACNCSVIDGVAKCNQ